MRSRRGMSLIWLGLLAGSRLAGEEPPPPVRLSLGHLTLTPAGFLDVIGMSRSATTKDSVSTRFGSIPLTDTPSESVASTAHSRVQVKGDLPAGALRFGGYVESDFMNPAADSAPWRWRQYFGTARWGKWELLGGQGWSLLRPNRTGMASDRELMHTHVAEPAYQVGLAGVRRRQVRLTREFGKERAAVAWESNGDWIGKLASDRRIGHLEVAAFRGRYGRSGANAAAIVNVSRQVRLIGQQFWSRRDLAEALSLCPANVGGWASLAGVEVPFSNQVELYSYAGEVFAQRSAGNHTVRQFSAGLNIRRFRRELLGTVLLSIQYSYLDRHLWDGRSGAMHYLMYRMRYTFQ
jgi:hypothetical protein